MSRDGGEILKRLAAELRKLPNKMSTAGQTNFHRHPPTANYTNRGLSADRAKVARRFRQRSVIEPENAGARLR
jgi:hypothetical protein